MNFKEKRKLIGQILANDTSYKMFQLLSEKNIYLADITGDLDTRVSNALHHIKKFEKLGILIITEKKLHKRGELHKFYSIDPIYIQELEMLWEES